MKITSKLIVIVALLLSLVMMFTSCEALNNVLGQIPGFEQTDKDDRPETPDEDGERPTPGGTTKPDDSQGGNTNPDDNQGGNTGNEDEPSNPGEGGNTDTENSIVVGKAYKLGMAQGNKGGEVYYLSGGTASTYYLATSSNILEAVNVYVEEAEGGYHLYYEKSGKNYINVEKVTGTDGNEHVNAVIGTAAVTVYTYDPILNTLVVDIDGVKYVLGTRNDKEYTTVGPCDLSKDPFICVFYGETSGNQGGGTGTDENGNFDLSLIPEPDVASSSFTGYYVVNGGVPFFTAEEKATTTCFEHYSNLDSLGRVGVAFACVCANTMPTTEREGQSYKPTGWVQNTYSIVSGSSLYNRSHLIAWSLAGENDTKENLATGTAYMNQTTMQIFENMVLNYLKANKSTNKVLYRVTPVFNGNNLLCSGVLMEAYSLDDNGADIQFCVFVYNVQKGIHLDYATGQNRLATTSDSPYYGAGAGFGAGTTGSNQGGNTGNEGGNTGNEGGTTVTPVPGDSYIISANNANGTLYFKGSVTSGRFDCTYNRNEAVEVMVSTVDGGYVLSFVSGGKTQYIVMGDSSTGGALTENAAEATVFEWNADLNTYVVADDSNNRGFGAGKTATHENFSAYDTGSTSTASNYNWGVFTKVDGTTNPDQGGDDNQGGTTTPAHECESECDDCGKCTDKACQEAACAEKCQGHNQTTTGYTKATSVEVGDRIIIVYEPAKAEFNGITNNIGTFVNYTDAPTGVWVLTLEAGSQAGTFAIKTPDGKYLYTTNENKIKSKTGAIDDSMSWTITFDASGNAIITNVGLTDRVLQWNRNSGQSRFCCYKNTMESVQIYK